MIKLLIGKPGVGKTKDIITNANKAGLNSKGNVIFIGESNESILEINHDVRYINISDYPITSSNQFISFIYGIIGADYDIESIYLDGISNIYIMTSEEICDWLEKIKVIADKYEIKFEISITIDGDLPECFNTYL